jgi:hypothetical protein
LHSAHICLEAPFASLVDNFVTFTVFLTDFFNFTLALAASNTTHLLNLWMNVTHDMQKLGNFPSMMGCLTDRDWPILPPCSQA